MSSNNKIVIYSNLPSGGGRRTYESTRKFLKKYFIVSEIKEPNYNISNIFQYLYTSLIIAPRNQFREIQKFNDYSAMVVYQSWLVKTPDILRYFNKPKVYICHEALLEYYDPRHIKIQTMKERLINLMRLPIKWRDIKNIQAGKTTIIANSKYSKKIIDKAYSVASTVVYPGIDSKKFASVATSITKNQVISVGAINKFKRQSFYVEVLSKIPIEIRPKLVLIGNGVDQQYLKYIKLKAKKLDVNLKIYINVTDKFKVKQLNQSKIFIFAPVSEPFGIVVEEAIASGLPVVLYKHGGGYIEVVSNRNGIIIDNLDVKKWATEIKTLLLDKSTSEKYNHQNRIFASKKLDSKIMNRNIMSILKKHL